MVILFGSPPKLKQDEDKSVSMGTDAQIKEEENVRFDIIANPFDGQPHVEKSGVGVLTFLGQLLMRKEAKCTETVGKVDSAGKKRVKTKVARM